MARRGGYRWGCRALALCAVAIAAPLHADVVHGSLPGGGCTIENNYGRSMAALRSGLLAVGSSGEFCGWIDVLDAAGTSVATLYDPDDTTFGAVVAAAGRDVLVASALSGAVLRVDPMTGGVRARLELAGGIPKAIAARRHDVAVLTASAALPDGLYVFDGRTGRLRRSLPLPQSEGGLRDTLVWVGHRLAVGDRRRSIVWMLDPRTGSVRDVLEPPEPGDAFLPTAGALAAGGKLVAVGSRAGVHLFDRRGRVRRTIPPPAGADCFGHAVAIDGDALLVGAPCTSDRFHGAAYLYSVRTGRLLASHAGEGDDEKLGSTVALLPDAVALGGRGPDTADNGIVRILPR